MGNDESRLQPVEPVQAGVTTDERQQLIAEAAYYRAERRGFAPGSEMHDWLEAEAEIDARQGKAGSQSGSADG